MPAGTFDDRPKPTPTLPKARAPIDATVEPFVGNESVDDNLLECVQVALWNALGDLHGAVTPKVKDGVVTLGGAMPSDAHHARALAATRKIKGVREVISEVAVAGPAAAGPRKRASGGRKGAVTHLVPEPYVYLVRYCSLEEASLSAAVRQGLDELDQFLAAAGRKPAQELLLIYRNRRPESDTVTLEIGVPVDADTADRAAGDLHAGLTPGGAVITRKVAAGMPALLEAERALKRRIEAGGARTRPYFWQRIDTKGFRPWTGHPAAPVHMPMEQAPEKSGVSQKAAKR